MKGQTTDGSTITLGSVAISPDEAGVLRVTVVGFDKTNGAAVTGEKKVRYLKTNGTLTLGTPTATLATAADTAEGSATFAIAAASNNVSVTVTGNAGCTIKWAAKVTKEVFVNS